MIYVLIAHGFEEIEALTAVDVLRRAGLSVKTVGVGAKTITGANGVTIHCDMIEHLVNPKDLEMLVLPGGMPGALNLEKSEAVQSLIAYAVANDRWLAAICAAPSILAHKGLLAGKRFTCYPGFEQDAQGEYLPDRVARDGKLVTGKGPGASLEFALTLAECLCGTEKAEEIRASLQ